MEIYTTGLDVGLLVAQLGFKGKKLLERVNDQLAKAALLVQREARRNAPRSPTQAQKNALKKTKRKGKRNNRATSRAKPRGLERSIEQKVYPSLEAEVFVAANSEAGKYAAKIHNEKGTSWRKRGPGTRAKGDRADHKFIERALADSEKKITEDFEKMIERIVKG